MLEVKHTNSQIDLISHFLEHTAFLQSLSGLRLPQPGDKKSDPVQLSQQDHLQLLKIHETFGAHFGCAMALSEQLSALHHFHAARTLEVLTSANLGTAAQLTSLRHAIASWEAPPAELGEPLMTVCTCIVWNTLLFFLHSV